MVENHSEKLPKFKLTKETTFSITIGFILSLVVGAFAFGGTFQLLRSDITQLQRENEQQSLRIENTETVNTDVRLELIKIRTQLDTLLSYKTGE